eukprot:13547014-Alexandrium_andersonii.AAC.1
MAVQYQYGSFFPPGACCLDLKNACLPGMCAISDCDVDRSAVSAGREVALQSCKAVHYMLEQME